MYSCLFWVFTARIVCGAPAEFSHYKTVLQENRIFYIVVRNNKCCITLNAITQEPIVRLQSIVCIYRFKVCTSYVQLMNDSHEFRGSFR